MNQEVINKTNKTLCDPLSWGVKQNILKNYMGTILKWGLFRSFVGEYIKSIIFCILTKKYEYKYKF